MGLEVARKLKKGKGKVEGARKCVCVACVMGERTHDDLKRRHPFMYFALSEFAPLREANALNRFCDTFRLSCNSRARFAFTFFIWDLFFYFGKEGVTQEQTMN